jgi:formate/nitrite transporter FocA (FNT family)
MDEVLVREFLLTKKISMKQLMRPFSFKMLAMSFVFALIQVIAFAQDNTGGTSTTSSGSSTTITETTKTTENWYASPWVWVVGAALFILLLVALLGGSRGRSTSSTTHRSTTATDTGDRVTVKKTVRRDTDTDV